MMVQLLGLGDAALDAAIAGFLLKSPQPSSTEVSDFLKVVPAGDQRTAAAQELIAKGVPAQTVSMALQWLATTDQWKWSTVKGIAAVAGSAAAAFHGYRRNQSIGWALVWALFGGVFPIFTNVVALAQGFGKRKAA